MRKIANSKRQMVNRRGFTLIELLIVVAIIGILATFLMVNFIGVRQRARDAQRKADLRQIQAALELYRADNSQYPDQASVVCGGPISSAGGTTYMKSVPCDPIGLLYYYTPSPDFSSYTLTACLENTADPQQDQPADGACNTGSSLTLHDP